MKFFCISCGSSNESVNGGKPKFCCNCGSPMDGQARVVKTESTASYQPPKPMTETRGSYIPPRSQVKPPARKAYIEDEEDYQDEETSEPLDIDVNELIEANIVKIDMFQKPIKLGQIVKESKLDIGSTRKSATKISQKNSKKVQEDIINGFKQRNSQKNHGDLE